MATLSMFIMRSSCKCPMGCNISGGSECQWHGYGLPMKYQKKLSKVTKLTDIVTLVIAIFEMSVSKALNDGKLQQQESDMLQTYFKVLNELMDVDCRMGAENRNQIEKSLLEEINFMKNTLKTMKAL